MSWEDDGKIMIHICECKHPLVPFYAVDYNEYACFKCGNVYPLLGRDRKEATSEDLKKEIESINLKKKFYDEHEEVQTKEYFKEWVEALK